MYDAGEKADYSEIQRLFSCSSVMAATSKLFPSAFTPEQEEAHEWFNLQSQMEYQHPNLGLQTDFRNPLLSASGKPVAKAVPAPNLASVGQMLSDTSYLSSDIFTMISNRSLTPDEKLKQMNLEIDPPFLQTPMGFKCSMSPENLIKPVLENHSTYSDCTTFPENSMKPFPETQSPYTECPSSPGNLIKPFPENQSTYPECFNSPEYMMKPFPEYQSAYPECSNSSEYAMNPFPENQSAYPEHYTSPGNLMKQSPEKQSADLLPPNLPSFNDLVGSLRTTKDEVHPHENFSSTADVSAGPRTSVGSTKKRRNPPVKGRSKNPTDSQKTSRNTNNGTSKKDKKVYKCNICCKDFARGDSLTVHMRIHTKEKPFSCEICNKSFTQKVHLKTHQKTHFRKPREA